MILKVPQYNPHGVNRCFDVEHHTKSFYQRSVMSRSENISIDVCNPQGTGRVFLSQLPG